MQTVISPIYERRPSSNGMGLVGFTVQIASEPFTNHIRFYDGSNRMEKLDELNILRDKFLKLLDEKSKPQENKGEHR